MPTRPRHYAVFILNPDGSGAVKQFDTWQEAMEAYSDASNNGKAVYLYPQPAKAVGIAPSGPGAPAFAAPAAAPIQFTAVQNVGQYQWPEHPPLPRPTEPPNGPFAPDNGYDAWLTYCVANPDHRECSIPGKQKFGTQVLVCEVNPFGAMEKSTDGTEYPRATPVIRLADGMGGTFPSQEQWDSEGLPPRKWYAPCQYPDGFREYREFTVTDFKEIAISSLVGSTVQTIRNSLVLMRATRELVQYTNDTSSKVLDENGVLPRGLSFAQRELEVNALREYEAGEPAFDFNHNDAAMGISVVFPLKPENDEDSELVDELNEPIIITVTETSNTHIVGYRTANVYEPSFPTTPPDEIRNVNYDIEGGLGTGTWDVKMTSPTTFEFYFTPTGSTPSDARPPAGWAGTVVRGANPTPDTNLRGGEFEGIDTTGVPPGGTYQTPWVYDYIAADTLLESDDENDYFTNGNGGYYAEPKDGPPDPPPDPVYDYEYNDIVIEESGQEVRTGSRRREVLGVEMYGPWEPWVYDPLGTAYEDALMSNANWRYTSACGEFIYKDAHKPIEADGNGGYIVGEEIYDGPSAGTVLQTCEQENLRYISDGAGYYTTEEISPPPPPCEDSALHTDGQEGWSYDGCYWNYDPNWNCEDPNLHSGEAGWSYDGCTWSYSEPPNCDASGTDYGVDPADSCYNLYADGNCGSYSSSNGSCGGNCEDPNLYSGQSGWSYDGCYWTYTPDCDSSGTMVGSTNDDVTYSNECSTYTIGVAWSSTYADGSCGTYTESGTTYNVGSIGECNGYNYYVNEDGTVTSSQNCDPSGTITDYGTPSDLTYETPCGTYTIGYSSQYTYADGMCGTYQSTGNTYNVGDFTTCNGNIYSVDSNGTVDSRPEPSCPPSGEWISSDECNNYYADGNCGSYSEDNGNCGGGGCDYSGYVYSTGLTSQLTISTPCGDADGGTRTYNEEADGNCGITQVTTNEAWHSNGTELNSCESNGEICTHYADGNGSYTTSCQPVDPPPPPDCEPSDLHVEGEDGWTYDGCHWNQEMITENIGDGEGLLQNDSEDYVDPDFVAYTGAPWSTADNDYYDMYVGGDGYWTLNENNV